MSEVRSRVDTFFKRYAAGEVAESAVDDYVEAWHASDESEGRPLGSFLGLTEQEYAVWVMDGRTLPVLRAARCSGEAVPEAVARYLEGLRAAADPGNRAAILSLSHWLERQGLV